MGSVLPQLVQRLVTSPRKENVIFLGPPGVGKTHLAISLAIAAAQSGRRVYYGALADLITSLEEAKTTGQLGRRLKILTYPSLLVIDEIGYLPVRQTPTVLDVYVIIELTGFAGRIPAI